MIAAIVLFHSLLIDIAISFRHNSSKRSTFKVLRNVGRFKIQNCHDISRKQTWLTITIISFYGIDSSRKILYANFGFVEFDISSLGKIFLCILVDESANLERPGCSNSLHWCFGDPSSMSGSKLCSSRISNFPTSLHWWTVFCRTLPEEVLWASATYLSSNE